MTLFPRAVWFDSPCSVARKAESLALLRASMMQVLEIACHPQLLCVTPMRCSWLVQKLLSYPKRDRFQMRQAPWTMCPRLMYCGRRTIVARSRAAFTAQPRSGWCARSNCSPRNVSPCAGRFHHRPCWNGGYLLPKSFLANVCCPRLGCISTVFVTRGSATDLSCSRWNFCDC